MIISSKNRRFAALIGASALALTFASTAESQTSRYGNSAHSVNPNHRISAPAPQIGHYAPMQMRKKQKKSGIIGKLFGGSERHLYGGVRDQFRGARLPQYQRPPMIPHPMDQFQRWNDSEPHYRLYPGDQIDIVVNSAPELSRTLTVGPHGRIVMPMAEPIMAAGKTMGDVQQALSAHLSKQLVDPRVIVTPRAYGPQQIYIGGEVAQQGTFTLPGPIGTLEAIFMAGGLRTSARSSQVVVLRRTPEGGFMARTVDFKDGLNNTRSFADNIQLRRGDIIFVPRSDIAEIGLFMQQYFRDAMPVNFNLSYQFGQNQGGTTVVSP